jgi:hypothetical protein
MALVRPATCLAERESCNLDGLSRVVHKKPTLAAASFI